MIVALALLTAPAAAPVPEGTLQAPFTIESRVVPSRTVQVWLPPGYDARRRYPVLYMMDGQNVFDTPAALSGHSWQVHRALAALIAQHRARAAIIVAVWSNDNRIGEYMPQAALAYAPADPLAGLPVTQAQVAGDAYLRFLVDELKPAIDTRYRTQTGRRDTFVMGSSMGGLIAAYAVTRYPLVFGGAAGLSSAWQIGGGFTERWYEKHLPPASTRVYFDYGTGTNDGVIGPWQARLDAAALHAGQHWQSKSWPGDAHTESAWAGRVQVPLVWLLGRR
jgi:predicted alpha/beta superfamily hydrolase